MPTDPHDLERFVAMQRDTHETARAEVARGRKRGHWMWYIFPQLAGLGASAMARTYAIASIDEAQAYLAHPILGARLIDMVGALQDLPATATAIDVFGVTDAMKLRSSLTLFALADGPPIISAAIGRWFEGSLDELTARLVGPHTGAD